MGLFLQTLSVPVSPNKAKFAVCIIQGKAVQSGPVAGRVRKRGSVLQKGNLGSHGRTGTPGDHIHTSSLVGPSVDAAARVFSGGTGEKRLSKVRLRSLSLVERLNCSAA